MREEAAGDEHARDLIGTHTALFAILGADRVSWAGGWSRIQDMTGDTCRLTAVCVLCAVHAQSVRDVNESATVRNRM